MPELLIITFEHEEDAEQARVRDDFADIFSAFASPANQRLFAQLLNGTEE